MRRILPLLPLLFLFPGCASDKDKDNNPYVKWEKKQDQDEDRRFFYDSWLHPTSDEPMYQPSKLPGPSSAPAPQSATQD